MTRGQYSVDTSIPAVVRKFDPTLTRRARPPPVHPARLGHAPDADPARPPGPTSAPLAFTYPGRPGIQADANSRNPENSISWQHRYGSRKNPRSRDHKDHGDPWEFGDPRELWGYLLLPRATRQVPGVSRIDPGSPVGMTLPRRAGQTRAGPVAVADIWAQRGVNRTRQRRVYYVAQDALSMDSRRSRGLRGSKSVINRERH